jgi:hypothetical protein
MRRRRRCRGRSRWDTACADKQAYLIAGWRRRQPGIKGVSASRFAATRYVFPHDPPDIRYEAGDQLLFRLPILVGLAQGSAVRARVNYRGKKVIGYRRADTIQDPAQPNNFGSTAAIDDPNVDAYTPIYSAPYKLVTATLGYTFKLQHSRPLQLQFRVANLFDDTKAIYTGATVQRPPDGDYTKTAARVSTPVNYRWETPRNYTLTATYSF